MARAPPHTFQSRFQRRVVGDVLLGVVLLVAVVQRRIGGCPHQAATSTSDAGHRRATRGCDAHLAIDVRSGRPIHARTHRRDVEFRGVAQHIIM